jgi:transposase-like protein
MIDRLNSVHPLNVAWLRAFDILGAGQVTATDSANLLYRDLEEMMNERGLAVDHRTIYRWVRAYAPELEKRIRPHAYDEKRAG